MLHRGKSTLLAICPHFSISSPHYLYRLIMYFFGVSFFFNEFSAVLHITCKAASNSCLNAPTCKGPTTPAGGWKAIPCLLPQRGPLQTETNLPVLHLTHLRAMQLLGWGATTAEKNDFTLPCITNATFVYTFPAAEKKAAPYFPSGIKTALPLFATNGSLATICHWIYYYTSQQVYCVSLQINLHTSSVVSILQEIAGYIPTLCIHSWQMRLKVKWVGRLRVTFSLHKQHYILIYKKKTRDEMDVQKCNLITVEKIQDALRLPEYDKL